MHQVVSSVGGIAIAGLCDQYLGCFVLSLTNTNIRLPLLQDNWLRYASREYSQISIMRNRRRR